MFRRHQSDPCVFEIARRFLNSPQLSGGPAESRTCSICISFYPAPDLDHPSVVDRGQAEETLALGLGTALPRRNSCAPTRRRPSPSHVFGDLILKLAGKKQIFFEFCEKRPELSNRKGLVTAVRVPRIFQTLLQHFDPGIVDGFSHNDSVKIPFHPVRLTQYQRESGAQLVAFASTPPFWLKYTQPALVHLGATFARLDQDMMLREGDVPEGASVLFRAFPLKVGNELIHLVPIYDNARCVLPRKEPNSFLAQTPTHESKNRTQNRDHSRVHTVPRLHNGINMHVCILYRTSPAFRQWEEDPYLPSYSNASPPLSSKS